MPAASAGRPSFVPRTSARAAELAVVGLGLTIRSMWNWNRIAALALMLLFGSVIAGEAGGAVRDPRMLVLPRKSVPSSFKANPATTGYTSLTRGVGGVARPANIVAIFKAWGFLRGYGVQYEPTGTRTGTGSPVWKGAISVISAAIVFQASHGANEWLTQMRKACTGQGERLLPSAGSRIGDETVLCEVRLQYSGKLPPGTPPAYSYEVFWRVATVAASIVVSGDKAQVSITDAVTLAKIQNSRMS